MATEMIFTWLRFLNEYLMKPSWFLFVAFYYPQELHLIDSILWNALLIFLLDGFILCLQFLFDHKIVTWKADLGFKKCNALNLCQTYFSCTHNESSLPLNNEVGKNNKNASTKISGFILVSESLLSLDLQGTCWYFIMVTVTCKWLKF